MTWWDIWELQDGNWQPMGHVRSASAQSAIAQYRSRHSGRAGRKLRATKVNKKRRNPAGAADAAFDDFHGYPSEQIVTVTKTVHYHGHLAAAGQLETLFVRSTLTGEIVILSDFKGALLAFNEKRDQLFIEGGDQRPNLKLFGIAKPHELQLLGEVVRVHYFARKDHLGKDGGVAIYDHKFEEPFPQLIYDTRNAQLSLAGGGYDILPEGIDH